MGEVKWVVESGEGRAKRLFSKPGAICQVGGSVGITGRVAGMVGGAALGAASRGWGCFLEGGPCHEPSGRFNREGKTVSMRFYRRKIEVGKAA